MSHTVLNEPEENLLEFSVKYLDAVFGTSDTPEVTLNQIEINDPSKPKIQPPDEEYVPSSQDPTQTERSNALKPLPIQNEQVAEESKKASSELINSEQTTDSSAEKDVSAAHLNGDSEEKAVSVAQLNSESKEKVVSATQLNSESKENTLEKRSSGLIDATLKRKSIMGLENIESYDNFNSEPITEELHIETDNPSHLFWVPAHLHPEIAPNEFRKWLKNHAKDYSSEVSSLRRRKSTLSRQYIPSENDEDEQPEKSVDTEKKRVGFDWDSFAASDENINISAESTKLNVIRRSLSLNLPPFMGSNLDPKDPNVFDRHSSTDVDSPVLIPRMAPVLKRTARTKIRRNSVAGEHNPRRFSAHRRTKSTHVLSQKNKNGGLLSTRAKKTSDPILSSTLIFSQLDESEDIKNDVISSPHSTKEINNDIELDFIESNDISGPIRITLKDNGPAPRRTSSLPQGAHEISDSLQEGRVPLPDKTKLYVNNDGTLKTTAEASESSNSSQISPDSTNPPQQKRSSTWTSWLFGAGSDEKDKESKTKKQKAEKVEHENTESVNKPKMSLSSIFSWSSQNKGKLSDDNIITTDSTIPELSPIPSTIIFNKKQKYTNYNRLPIHVERSVYRLSHFKLANPRRPLHEQVLISNMMFWYLSLINKQQVGYGGEGNINAEKEAIKVKSKVGKSNGGRKRRKGEKKGALFEARRRGGPSAEIAYRAPQYDMQQIPQYLTQGKPPYSPEYSEELEAYSDSEDSSEYSEEEIYGRKYHHYDDGYVSDGTDGGYINDNQDFNGDSMGFNYNMSMDEVRGESNSNTPLRSPAPNGKSSLLLLKNRLTPSNARLSANKRATSPARPRSSSPGPRHKHSKPLASNTKNNSKGDEDEDDDVPLGLYKTVLTK